MLRGISGGQKKRVTTGIMFYNKRNKMLEIILVKETYHFIS